LEPEPSLAAVIVSEARPPVEVIQRPGHGIETSIGPAQDVTYVSLPPGTLPDATGVSIRNLDVGGPIETTLVPVIDGGFDPVPVAAVEGDRLELGFDYASGDVRVEVVRVPARRPPVLVRTTPARGRTDVPLDVLPAAVFSEPVDPGGAWDLFVERYRPLMRATIRRMIPDREDAFDVFAHVCHALFDDDMARLRRFRWDEVKRAEFSTWLVTVVHNVTIDWLRRQNGRPRVKTPAGLTPLQQRIFQFVFVERRSHLEAYELACAAEQPGLAFGVFLRELADTYRLVQRAHPDGALRYLFAPPPLDDVQATHLDADRRIDASALSARLSDALDSLSAEDRLAVQLYVVRGLPAAEVARVLGWPNAKAVYNGVYRGLARLRSALESDGLGPVDA
jgi:RNA polymerase sigma factor (sigma-70 family)